jgi:hypothetical protein
MKYGDPGTFSAAKNNRLIAKALLVLAGWLMVLIGLVQAFGWPAFWIWLGVSVMTMFGASFALDFDKQD